MSLTFHIIIPARFQSTRFPGKLLMEIQGMSILQRVYQQATLANPQRILIATDHEAIAEHAQSFGAEVLMTSPLHQSGTDRLAEAVAKGAYCAEDVIVNVQGDEPFIAPQLIRQVANALTTTQAPMATLCWPITHPDLFHNPNVVKVVRSQDNHALYFSRSPIPAHRDHANSFKNSFRHIGLYAYRASFLRNWVHWPVCDLEVDEALEQLRVLWNGFAIKVDTACVEPLQDINTKEDWILAQELCKTI